MLPVEIPAPKSSSVPLFPLFFPSFCALPPRSHGEPSFGMKFCPMTLCCWLLFPSISARLWPTWWRYVGITVGCEKVPGECGLWVMGEETTFLLCRGQTWSPGCRAQLYLASRLYLLEAGVSCDGWLLFLPDLFHFISRWAFLPKQTAPAVNTPVLILTVMRTSMPSSTVSWPLCILLSAPFFLLLVTGWSWSLLNWLGSFHLFLNFLSLDLGVN